MKNTKKQIQSLQGKNTKLRKDDNVLLMSGKDKGKTGRILYIDRKKGRVIVEKVNMVKKMQRPTQENPKGGILEIEAAMHISNLMLVDPKNNKQTRLGYEFDGEGNKVRIAKKSGKPI
ncbi:MAG: 50S ribosomal protein L24 [Spirochaetes bacterium]|nr:50S ribosomal protein L24 [Spirochaetota bacterium]